VAAVAAAVAAAVVAAISARATSPCVDGRANGE
jgi:hypothetical protein